MKALAPLAVLLAAVPSPAADLDITVDVAKPTVELSPHLYGLFFEDINFAADGGIYAELVQNRSFEYHSVNGNDPAGRDYHPLYAWEKIERDGAACELGVVDIDPLNGNNTKYLALRITEAGGAGVRNLGFDGIRLDAGAKYDVSLYARTAGWEGDGRIDLALELPGGAVAGTASFEGVGGEWGKLEGVIESSVTSDVGRLVVTTPGRGTLHLDMVSLFPQDTWKGRKGGLRRDLVEALRELEPKFLRFPGGCIAHGHGLDNLYRWKDTVGDVAERKPNWNLWGYHQTYGLGYFEYFQLCEDLGMHPLPVVPVGVSCGFREPQQAVPMDEMDACVQDALDLIEFATGPADSEWGSVRARMGHPEPFEMEFICLGNEPHDNRLFRDRFPLFTKAIREQHPELRIIGTSGLGWQIPIYDLMTREKVYSSDEHYYESPEWYLDNVDRFDDFDRDKPKIFIGEYASRGSTLFNALAEAAYLTGVERNGDIVDMTCYAPLFAHVGHKQWDPDLIYFDKRTVVRSANYHVQQLFARNKGDVYLANRVERNGSSRPATLAGSVGVGTWRTTIEVDRLMVNGRRLDPAGFRTHAGDFRVEGHRYLQADVGVEGALAMSRERFEGDKVTYTIRARKTGGDEGFLVVFGGTDRDNTYWWNIGGWDNSRHGLEWIVDGSSSRLDERRGSVESDRWYDLKVELTPGRVRCFIDGGLIHDVELGKVGVSVASTLDRAAGEVIVKLVNPTAEPREARIRLEGVDAVDPEGTLLILHGERSATNTIQHPDRVHTRELPVRVSQDFEHLLPAMSVQFLRIKVPQPSPGAR